MISTLDIKCNVAHPNMPLSPFFAFRNSPSSVRVLDVPRKIGQWSIESVQLKVEYPDHRTILKECVRNGNVWIATVEGCDVSGSTDNGYSILGSGVDELGQRVENYVFGKGTVYIMDDDSVVHPGIETWTLHFLDSKPTKPLKGDVVFLDGCIEIFDGEKWNRQFVPDISTKRDKDDLSFDIPERANVDKWTVVANGTTTTLEWQSDRKIWQGQSQEFGFMGIQTDGSDFIFTNTGGEHRFRGLVDDYVDDWGISYSINGTPLQEPDRLVLKSETKTVTRVSELENDANYIHADKDDQGNMTVNLGDDGQTSWNTSIQVGYYFGSIKVGTYNPIEIHAVAGGDPYIRIDGKDVATQNYVDQQIGDVLKEEF